MRNVYPVDRFQCNVGLGGPLQLPLLWGWSLIWSFIITQSFGASGHRHFLSHSREGGSLIAGSSVDSRLRGNDLACASCVSWSTRYLIYQLAIDCTGATISESVAFQISVNLHELFFIDLDPRFYQSPGFAVGDQLANTNQMNVDHIVLVFEGNRVCRFFIGNN